MTQILSLILITSIWVLGLTIATQEDMILYSWRQWGDKKHEEGKKWIEPVILCFWCMPSIHSIVGYLFGIGIGVINHFEWKLVFAYPLVVMGSSMLNGLIWGTHKLIEAKTHYFNNAEILSHFDIRDRKERHQKTKGTNH